MALALHLELGLALALVLALCPLASMADPRTSVAGQRCADGAAVSGSTLANNFVPAMDDLNTNVSAHGYGTSAVGGPGGPNTVFGLGQCLRDLSPIDCKLCFAEVRSLLPKCYPRVGGRLYLDGCFGRYANYSFFGEALDASADAAVCGVSGSGAEGGGNNYTGDGGPRAFGAAVRAALANVTAAAAAPGSEGFGAGSDESGGATAFALAQCWESLNGTACAQCLRAASDAVAACAPATEGRALFTGCYLRYSTRLFWNVNGTGGSDSSEDTSRRRNLTWNLRVDIIQGIAEGLSYLHEDSETRIIHRDIKASNILLDDKLKPKITDFGLARAFGEDVTHLTTGVAGTLGYMAPEYIVHGHLTEKADVFSYGVLVLEIVTGQRCSSSSGSHGGQVWKHYKDNTVEMIVDQSIYEDTIRDEIMHIVQIGLLCTQADPDDRPTMGKVVELLRNHRNDLEIVLSDPPFLNVEAVEDIKGGEHSRLLSKTSAPSLSGSWASSV
nr:unnamed protein product [Digitaria exilis]